jgi:hypothetical protein
MPKSTPPSDKSKSPSDLKRLMAKGTEIKLKGGASVRLVLEAEALCAIEDEYGNLNAFAETLQAATGGKMFHHLVFTLAAALGMSREETLSVFDTKQTGRYIEAISVALAEALPLEEEQGNGSGNGRTAPSASPGAATSTSASSSGASLPATSGT